MIPILALFILAVIQGLTEFLPVSSSGHLVLARSLLPGGDLFQTDGALEVLLHLGTLGAILFYFRKHGLRLFRQAFSASSEAPLARHVLLILIAGTLPLVVVTLLGRDRLDSLFQSPTLASSGLLATAGLLAFSRSARRGNRKLESLTLGQGLCLGMAQACALCPGVSRSGAVIVAGLILGLAPAAAFEFAFLLAIPALAGAGIWHFWMKAETPSPELLDWVVGVGTSLGVGLVALALLAKVVRGNKLHYFAPWCAAVGSVGLVATWAA